MIFGVDFDDTFTADPTFFHEFLDLMTKHNHKAVIVTRRKKPSFGEPSVMGGINLSEVTKDRLPVVFANGSDTKREAAIKAGYKINVWIDDSPFYIDGEKPYK